MSAQRQTGKVKSFLHGYGFIEPQDGGTDVFVHFSEIQMDGYKQLVEGEIVEYEVATGDKGVHAKDVVRIEA